MKKVVYNKGGHVAHVSVKIDSADSFDAMAEAATIAHAYGGNVEALYSDSKAGQRSRIGGAEKAGLVLEVGTLNDNEELARDVDRLRAALNEMGEEITRQHGLLWLVGLDTHPDEQQQTMTKSIANLRRLLRGDPQ